MSCQAHAVPFWRSRMVLLASLGILTLAVAVRYWSSLAPVLPSLLPMALCVGVHLLMCRHQHQPSNGDATKSNPNTGA